MESRWSLRTWRAQAQLPLRWPALSLFVLAGTLLASRSLQATNRFLMDEVRAAEGEKGSELYVRAEHDVAIAGFSVSIRYQPLDIAVVDVTIAGTDAEGAEFWDGNHDRTRGEIAYGAILDLSPNPGDDAFLPPGPEHSLVRLVFDVLAPAGTVSPVVFEDGLGIFQPVDNIITDAQGRTVFPELLSGAVRVVPPAGTQRARFGLRDDFDLGVTQDGSRALLFAGEVDWLSALEDGLWTRAVFAASGPGDESALLAAGILYADLDGDGTVDLETEKVAEADPIEGDDGEYAFDFRLALETGKPLFFVLAADLKGEAVPPSRAGLDGPLGVVGLGILALLACACACRRRGYGVLVCGLFLLAVSSCNGGGGGGGGAPPSPGGGAAPRSVRFELAGPSSVSLEGAESGFAADIEGLPLRGPEIEI